MDIEPGSIIAGKFRLEHPLSRGGMGSVWVARHVLLGHTVAVKFMDGSFAASPAFRTRFEREARAAANLQTPHVVQVQDYGIDAGVPYLVMELLQGEDLNARLQRYGRISLQEAWSILAQAGKALRRAHEAGLIHRDLKPGNLFLARIEDDEVVKVLDFGIAKETGRQITGEATRTGEILGSPHYMSPEQVRGDRDLDLRSDVWSLGVIVFRAITGHLPFPGDQLGLVMAHILVDPIPTATQVAPDLPPALDGFFARAFARDRTQRFQSVREMLDDFARVAGAPPRAAVGSMPEAPLQRDASMAGIAAPLPGFSSAALPATLTGTADVTGDGASRTLRAKMRWRFAIGAVVMLGGGGAVLTMSRLGGAPASDPAAAVPAIVVVEESPESAPTSEAPAPSIAETAEEIAAPVVTPENPTHAAQPGTATAPAPTPAPKPTSTATARAKSPRPRPTAVGPRTPSSSSPRTQPVPAPEEKWGL